MVTCSNCGAGIPDDSAFCGQCGAPRPDEVEIKHEPVPEAVEKEAAETLQMVEPESPMEDPTPIQDYPPPAPVQDTGKRGNTCLWFALGCLFLILVILCVMIIVFAFSLSTATDILNQVF